MFKDLSLTLYDLFGYLFPGIVSLVAMVLLFWWLFYRKDTIVLWGYDAAEVTAVIGLAYVVGHSVQAWGNLIEKWINQRHTTAEPEHLLPAIRQHLATSSDESGAVNAIEDKTLLRLCDYSNVVDKANSLRDIFIYRKGFYRGLVVSFVFLTVVLIIVGSGAPLRFEPKQNVLVVVPREAFTLSWLISLVGVVTFWFRYLRFMGYRRREVLITFSARYLLGKPGDAASGAEEPATPTK